MLYLATFYWVWLLASLSLGLAMGWIAVVHRGHGVSKPLARWLGALVAALVAASLSRVILEIPVPGIRIRLIPAGAMNLDL